MNLVIDNIPLHRTLKNSKISVFAILSPIFPKDKNKKVVDLWATNFYGLFFKISLNSLKVIIGTGGNKSSIFVRFRMCLSSVTK